VSRFRSDKIEGMSQQKRASFFPLIKKEKEVQRFNKELQNIKFCHDFSQGIESKAQLYPVKKIKFLTHQYNLIY
jgi:hypothetical protein